MKKVFLASLIAAFAFTGCATNFGTWDAWKADKQGEKYAAEVLTSEVKDGSIYGTAKIYKTGAVVKYVQKPYFKTDKPFDKGYTIFVNIDGNK
jgi:hypothetical protein